MDRIRNKAQGWANRFLSGAGKEILLKAVIAAMPTYAMSSFKLPVSLCKRIQSALTRFWWDNNPEKRKMCWVSWDSLSRPKGAGGLGFREIENFNDALLGKLSWRILKNPQSLLGQVLLGKYCHNKLFMNSSLPSNPSHGWRGIMAGREVLRKGLGWIVGDGKSIKVWEDAWLSTSSPISIADPPLLTQENLKVSDFLHPEDNSWDVNMIRTHLPLLEPTIRSLRPSCRKTEDVLAWLPNSSGIYSSKSGYNLIKKNRTDTQASTFNWSKFVWQTKTSPKIKNFLWKIASGALPAGDQLASRGLQIDSACKRCGEKETILHLLVQCPFAASVWNMAPLTRLPPFQNLLDPKAMLIGFHQSINLPPTGLSHTAIFPWVLWNLWSARNQLLFADKTFSDSDTIQKAIKDAIEWHNAQPRKETETSSATPVARATPLPSASMLCIETDASWLETKRFCGLGCIGRDNQGSILFKSSATEQFVASVIQGEALAIKAGLQEASLHGFSTVAIKSDSKTLIELLRSGKVTNELVGLLHDIRSLAANLVSVTFQFIPRSANTVADEMAKSALSTLVSSSFGDSLF